MRWILAAALMLLSALPASAEVPLSGNFTASAACPAFQSINRQTNPGNVQTKPGTSYTLLAGNRAKPSHLWIVVPGASPERRWVAVECGQRSGQPTVASKPAYRGTQYVLAVNWQPAFCETSPRQPECRAQRANSFEATNFTLHGLWPQPRDRAYCDVPASERWASEDGDWRDLPRLPLSLQLQRELDKVMPGTLSGLDRHEWTKHGSCYGTPAEEYYADSLALMTALNRSAVAELFADNIGRKITLRQVREAFDAAFGPGAGERVQMDCATDGNRTIITELTIALTGEISGPEDMAGLMAAASPLGGGCNSGMVDAVGLR
ncbi:ribonuclease T2 family protein [Devosia sp. A449]